ncbi:MAG: hypothetical protein RL701_4518 [Pseudomonadota bacterium]|jgi:hypothetical protein
MTINVNDLKERAERRCNDLVRAWSDPRYTSVIGRFLGAQLLMANDTEIEPHHQPIALADALWAGNVEPRVLELLPASLVLLPSMFTGTVDMPEDLSAVVAALREQRQPPDFRNVPGAAILQWLNFIATRESPSAT